jgi:hypothetical protein
MGERMGRIGQIETDFFFLRDCLDLEPKFKQKNPLKSAQSALSVFPLYHKSIIFAPKITKNE